MQEVKHTEIDIPSVLIQWLSDQEEKGNAKLPKNNYNSKKAYLGLKGVQQFVINRLEEIVGFKFLEAEFQQSNMVISVKYDVEEDHWELSDKLIQKRFNSIYKGITIL